MLQLLTLIKRKYIYILFEDIMKKSNGYIKICQNPLCKKEFIANRQKRKICSEKCNQEYAQFYYKKHWPNTQITKSKITGPKELN
jgi:hypothetical protein